MTLRQQRALRDALDAYDRVTRKTPPLKSRLVEWLTRCVFVALLLGVAIYLSGIVK